MDYAAAAGCAEQVLNAAKMLLDIGDEPLTLQAGPTTPLKIEAPDDRAEVKFGEVFYMADPNRTVLRFEGLPIDIVMSDAEAHALAGRIARGNEPEKIGSGPVKMVRARDMQFGESGWYHDKGGAVLLTRADAMTRMSSPPRYRFKRVDEVEMLLTGDVLLEVRGGEQPPAVSFFTERQLLTAADFKSEDEFEVYRAGADRLPLGLLPGSWEAHLLTAAAAMVVAGIERHEARMAPPDAERVFDESYARLSQAAKAALESKAADQKTIRDMSDRIRGLEVERGKIRRSLEMTDDDDAGLRQLDPSIVSSASWNRARAKAMHAVQVALGVDADKIVETFEAARQRAAILPVVEEVLAQVTNLGPWNDTKQALLVGLLADVRRVL